MPPKQEKKPPQNPLFNKNIPPPPAIVEKPKEGTRETMISGRDTETSSTNNSSGESRTNTKEEKKQHTLYLPPSLSKWLKVQAIEEDRDMSDIAADALELYKNQKRPV